MVESCLELLFCSENSFNTEIYYLSNFLFFIKISLALNKNRSIEVYTLALHITTSTSVTRYYLLLLINDREDIYSQTNNYKY